MRRALQAAASRVSALLVLLLAAGAVPLWAQVLPAPPPAAASPVSAEAREAQALALKRVSEQLICQCGCNMILSECSHQSCPFALPQRKKILDLLAAGSSEAAVIEHYVQNYGRAILSAPPTSGGRLDRAAWVAPWAALAVGLLVAAHFVRQFTRRAAAARRPTPAAPGAAAVAAGPDGGAPAADPWLRRVEQELKGRPSGDRS